MCYYGVVVCLLFMFSVNVSRLKSGLISALADEPSFFEY